jgi:hypothetical protein
MGDLSPHFDASEFACGCGCGFGTRPGDVQPGLLEHLEAMRTMLGRGIAIGHDGGCRCEAQNKIAGGVPNSAHTHGGAADVETIGGLARYEVIVAAVVAAIEKTHNIPGLDFVAVCREVRNTLRGLGIGTNFVHVETDVRSTAPRPAVWGYEVKGE